MLQKFEDLNSLQLDTLKEIGNIGSSNAANALYSMINKKIDMSIPEVKVLGFQEAIEVNGSPEDIVGAVLVRLKQDVNGMMLLLIEPLFANIVISSFFGADYGNKNVQMKYNKDARDHFLIELSEEKQSALVEVGNIMAGAFLNAIGEISHLNIGVEIPSYTADMLGAVMSVPVIEFGEIGDKLLCINQMMEIDGVAVRSNMLLIPTVESVSLLFTKLGV